MKIVLLEFQTNWTEKAVWRLIDYVSRFKLKYGLPVLPTMLLFRPHSGAVGEYEDECFLFRYELIKLWEYRAADVIERELYALMPFVPVMDSTEADVYSAERLLYESELPRVRKSDLLTALSIFAGLRDGTLARELFNRRRDIMIESPVYEMIKEEGEEKGKIGGLRTAVIIGLKARFGDASEALIERVEKVEDAGKLEALQVALVSGKSIDEVKDILDEK